MFTDDAMAGLNYVVGVRMEDGIAAVARVHASHLGLDTPEMLAAELRLIQRRRSGMFPCGTGDPERRDTWPDDLLRVATARLLDEVDELLQHGGDEGGQRP